MHGSRPHVLQHADCNPPYTLSQEQRTKAPSFVRSVAQTITDAFGFWQRQANTLAGCLSIALVSHNIANRNTAKGLPRTVRLARSFVGKIHSTRALSQLSRFSVVVSVPGEHHEAPKKAISAVARIFQPRSAKSRDRNMNMRCIGHHAGS
jgi:hypothetical protein